MKKLILVFWVIFFVSYCSILSVEKRREYVSEQKLFIANLDNAPFPHFSRERGYKYNNIFYSSEKHYNDSRVAFYIPKGYNKKKRVDVIVHFHGWNAELTNILERDHLVEQVSLSRKNVILLVPQGPKNAPDSVFGKLETRNGFKKFIFEALEILKNQGFTTSSKPGRIILSGHSGGYRVISYIITRGGLVENIREVYLFDALYGQLEKYVFWFDNYNVKFINLYIKKGSTYAKIKTILEDLYDWDYPYAEISFSQLSKKIVKRNSILFVSSPADHNEIVYKYNPLTRLLRGSRLKIIQR